MSAPDPDIPALAEGRWFWRRLYVFASSVVAWSLIGWAVARTGPDGQPAVARGLMALLGLMLVLYLAAPTAQQIVAILAGLRPHPGLRGRP